MKPSADNRLTTIEQVRAIIGEEVPVVRAKLFRGLDEAAINFIPEILERLSARGQPALLAIRVRVERCFFHCAKAFKRSRLWRPESWPERLRISFGKLLAPRLGGGEELERSIDQMIEEDYKTNL
jgi:predicted pyridoxine 5'-phosphate oxidase superfamily flavin-nucleotide-binding protein